MVEGKVSEKDSSPKILCEHVQKLDKENLKNKKIRLVINQNTQETLLRLKELLQKYPGENEVYLSLQQNGNFKNIKTSQKINFNCELKGQLITLLGQDNIKLDN